jgi:hypothetical protein
MLGQAVAYLLPFACEGKVNNHDCSHVTLARLIPGSPVDKL